MSVNCPAAAEEVRLLLARIIHEKRLLNYSRPQSVILVLVFY